MVDLNNEILNLNYHEMDIPLSTLFPKLNENVILARFKHLKRANPHETIYHLVKAMAEGGYSLLLKEQGFWNPEFQEYSRHANQCTPLLGLVLTLLGFECSYLECYRVRDHITRTGMVDVCMPNEEIDLKKKAEYSKLRRIPYSILEVTFKGQKYYISGKHLTLEGEYAKAELQPISYQDFVGIFRHQDDSTKSGIYVKAIIPQNNLHKINYQKQVLWAKQTLKEDFPEYYLTYFRMKLIK